MSKRSERKAARAAAKAAKQTPTPTAHFNVVNLASCKKCNRNNSMIFPGKTGWYIACGYRTCTHSTEQHEEVLDAAAEWGL